MIDLTDKFFSFVDKKQRRLAKPIEEESRFHSYFNLHSKDILMKI